MWRVWAGLLLFVGLVGCSSLEEAVPPEPLVLKIAVNDVYCHDTACSCVYEVAARTYPELLKQLEEKSGIRLELVYFTETYQLEDAIASGEYEGALCKPWYALRHEKEVDANFERIVDVLDPDDNPWLTGMFIVPADSPIRSFEQLEGCHLYIGEADSYEKHYAALRLLKERGVHPAQIDENASCSENIGVLLDEKADAAVISDYSLHADCAVDFASPEAFRVLAYTEKIPLTSLLLDMNRVSAADAERLKKALLELSGSKAPKSLLGSGFVPAAPWDPPELEPKK